MKRILYFLNLTEEDGKLNFVHAIVVGCSIYLVSSRSVDAAALVAGSFALLAWNWKVKPSGKKVSSLEVDQATQKSQEALDQIKKLSLKLGFGARA